MNKEKQILAKILKYKLFGKTTPIRVKHYITFRCNSNCKFCYTKNQVSKELSTTEIIKKMEYFKKLGCFQWTFIGGEPVLREDLPILIKNANKLKFNVRIATNGSLITENFLKKVNKVDKWQVSLDGFKEIHNYNNQSPIFDKVLKGIDLLLKHKQKVEINAVITTDNILNIKWLCEFCKDNNLDLNLSFEYPIKDYYMNKKIIDLILNFKKEYKCIINNTETLKQKLRFINKDVTKFQNKCYAGLMFLSMLPDGNLIPCYAKLQEKYKDYKDIIKNNNFNCDCSIDCFYDFNRLIELNKKYLTEKFKKNININ